MQQGVTHPRIFRQIEQYGRSGRYEEPSDAERYQLVRKYFSMLVEEGLPDAAGKMKQFTAWFTHGVPNGSTLRKAVYGEREATAILERVEEFWGALV